MVRLEELPDDFDERMDLNKGPQPVVEGEDASMDDFFDRAMARGGITNKTFEEAMSDLSKSPLFMTSLDQAGNDNEANIMLEALQAMQYEGTKSEIAQGFKDQGNEAVLEKRWKDAKEFYSKGIAVLLGKDDSKWDKPENIEDEARQLQLLNEQLHVNRARCNLELSEYLHCSSRTFDEVLTGTGNYRSTTLDCAAALKVNPNNVKAHYRSASALFALDKVYEALDVCYRGYQLDTSNKPMKVLLDKIQKRSRVNEMQDQKRRDEELRRQKEKAVLAAALQARNIRVRGSARPPDMGEVEIRLSPDPLSPTSLIEFPVMLLYPMHNQSDLIRAFAEKDMISDHLGYILPTPWDSQGQYATKTVDCYMDTSSGGLMKVGKNLSLLEVLSGGNVEVLDGLVRIYVVPRALAPAWIEEVKRKKGK